MYSKEYFKLQTIFAQRCAEILGKDLPYCLFHYTANYLRLGLSKPFNENDPTWVSAVRRINAGEDATEVIYSFYQQRDTNQTVDDRKYFGFFGYDWDDEGKRVKLHFSKLEDKSVSPLDVTQQNIRKAELKVLLIEAIDAHPDARYVKSTSWLYDLEIMNRFLPQEFLDSREIVELKDELQYLGCWGQFLKRDGNIREDDAQVFIEKIQKAETFDQLVECFPHNIFKCQVEIEIFKEFLDI